MWWWQSQALAGAFSLGASVPSDHLTCCAAASPAPIMPAAAPADIAISNSRRPQEIATIASSHRLWRRGLSTESPQAWPRRCASVTATGEARQRPRAALREKQDGPASSHRHGLGYLLRIDRKST